MGDARLICDLKKYKIALLPWVGDLKMQKFIQTNVTVHEERSPQFSLYIRLEYEKHGIIKRRILKNDIIRTLKYCKSRTKEGEKIYTRSARETEVLDAKRIDVAMEKWLATGQTPPQCGELALWIISRILLQRRSEHYNITLFGEVEVEKSKVNEVRKSSDGIAQNTMSGEIDDDDLPPAFEETIDQRQMSEFENIDRLGDEGSAGEVLDTSALVNEDRHDPRPRGEEKKKALVKDLELAENSRDQFAAKSQYQIEPSTVRLDSRAALQSRRPHSASSTLTIGPKQETEWSNDNRRFQIELKLSKKELDQAKNQQAKAQIIADARIRQIMQEARRKIARNKQIKEEVRQVKQSISDTLEYRDILDNLEAKKKRAEIAAKKEQAKITQAMRISVGRTEKWRKGPVLGPGPVSQLELNTSCIGEDCQDFSFVYDQHGRRHSIEEAGNLTAQGVFESAMTKIRRLMQHDSAKNVDVFRRYDTNRSGTLDIHEFVRALEDSGIILNVEQAQVIFNHFDPNGSGEIDYGELLWGFFNRKAFLKRWRLRKKRLSQREIRMMFFKYDRTWRGVLSLPDFQLAMEDMGFKLSETDVKMLGLKFDRNHDGFIDYKEFEQFLDEQASSNTPPPDYDETGESTKLDDSSNKLQVKQQKHTSPSQNNDEDDLDNILRELKELNSTQEEIRKILPKK